MRALRASCSLVESGRGDGPPLERCGKSMGSFTGKAIQRAHHDGGSMIVGWCHGGLEGAGICSLLGAYWFGV